MLMTLVLVKVCQTGRAHVPLVRVYVDTVPLEGN